MSDVPDLAYIYLIQDGNDKGTNIRKIGKTVQKGGDTRIVRRIQQYNKGTIIYHLWKVDEKDIDAIEDKIKCQFKVKYKLARGSEWFEGDVNNMKKDIDEIVDGYICKDVIVPSCSVIKCDNCYKIFKHKYSLKLHANVCKGISLPFQCTKCMKILSSKSGKCKHMKICKGTNNNLKINMRNFGDENLDHITDNMMDEFKQQPKAIGILNLVKAIHFNPDVPENHNVRKYEIEKVLAQVFNDGDWELQDRKSVISNLIEINKERLNHLQFDYKDPANYWQCVRDIGIAWTNFEAKYGAQFPLPQIAPAAMP